MVGHRLSSKTPPWAHYYGVPPRALLEPKIEVTTDAYEHWYWLGDFNERGEAIIRWNPARRLDGAFIVVRVLLHHDLGPLPKAVRISSVCGLAACINWRHWLVQTKEEWIKEDNQIWVNGRPWPRELG